jgi:hypothetical protein
MTSMKKGRWYIYSDVCTKNKIIKIGHIKHLPDGCIYGVNIRYKIYADTKYSDVGILYTSRYYWDKYAKELTDEEVIVECL